MKITLAFCLHNVEADIESVLRSWLDNLSGKHAVEVIAVFDDCTDKSAVVAARTMAEYGDTTRYLPLHTDNLWEVRCNNRALEQAQGDVFISAQGDNWMHTPGWDDAIARVMQLGFLGPRRDVSIEDWQRVYGEYSLPSKLGSVGAIGLLAGVQMNKNFTLNRIECHRPHKDERAWVHGLGKDQYPLAVYEVDAINRPFAVRTDILRGYGGLDEAYCPMDWDDADLSFRLLRDGYTNLYIPFDLVNTSAKQQTLTSAQMSANYQHGEAIAKARWSKFVAERETSVRALYSLTEDEQGRLLL